MQLSKTQISALLTEIASQEDGLNEILRMSFEAMMKAERQEHLIQAQDDKGNGFRQVKAYGRCEMLESRVLRTREGNFYPLLMRVLRDQDEESRKIAFELYGAFSTPTGLPAPKPSRHPAAALGSFIDPAQCP
jgi:transposase-like protein